LALTSLGRPECPGYRAVGISDDDLLPVSRERPALPVHLRHRLDTIEAERSEDLISGMQLDRVFDALHRTPREGGIRDVTQSGHDASVRGRRVRQPGAGETRHDAGNGDQPYALANDIHRNLETRETGVVVPMTQQRLKIGDSRRDSNDTAQRLAWAHCPRRQWQGGGFPPGSCPELTRKRSGPGMAPEL